MRLKYSLGNCSRICQVLQPPKEQPSTQMLGCRHRSRWLHLHVINRSIFTFHHRLRRCVSKFFRFTTSLFVVKRPGVDEFLERIGEKYKVVAFTAGLREYASPVLDKLDKNHVISQRLYRDSCKEMDGRYVKDLSWVVGKNLRSVVIVDDNPFAYFLQPENAVPIKPFVDDMKDQELKKLMEFFERCDGFEDMRDAVKEFLANRLT